MQNASVEKVESCTWNAVLNVWFEQEAMNLR